MTDSTNNVDPPHYLNEEHTKKLHHSILSVVSPCKFIPVVSWLPKYKITTQLKYDLLAGISSGITVIPQGLAYATVAGLPPIYGLYSAIIPALVYFFFGGSHHLIVGPTAVMSLLIGSQFHNVESLDEYKNHVFLVSMLSGMFSMAFGFLRLGFIANFLSHPIISGFTSAASILIIIQQLPHLFGLHIASNEYFVKIIRDVSSNLTSTNLYSMGIGISSILIILLLQRIPKLKVVPGALVVVVLGTLVSWWLKLDSHGVSVIGEIPRGFPPLTTIEFSYCVHFPRIFSTAVLVTLIGFIEGFSIGKTFARSHHYDLNANVELVGIGMANLVGSFFSCYPSTGSFSRTAVNARAGATSQVANMIAALLVLLCIQFLTPLCYYLPKSVLAAVIITAVLNLFDYKEILFLYRTKKSDLLILLVTLISTLTLSVELGISLGFATALVIMLICHSKPVTEMFQVTSDNQLEGIREGHEIESATGIAMITLKEPLHFVNVTVFKETALNVTSSLHGVNKMILDMQGCHHIDSSGVHCIVELLSDLHEKGVEMYLVHLNSHVFRTLESGGTINLIGRHRICSDVQSALALCKARDLDGDRDEQIPLLRSHQQRYEIKCIP